MKNWRKIVIVEYNNKRNVKVKIKVEVKIIDH